MLKSPLKVVWFFTVLLAVNGAIGGRALARSGQDGLSKTIFLESQSQPQSIDLSGSNGSAGTDGEDRSSYGDDDSSSLSSCHESDVGKAAKNITMPSGKNGEAGEAGGNGGNGGDLTIYYQRRSDLKQIFVNAAPGRGGPGGRGGRGAKGCRCPQSDWKVEGKTYHCTNGKRGIRGSDGTGGANGTIGRLRLIEGTKTIAGDTPQVRTTLNNLSTLQSIPLTLNRWDVKYGARGLLQENSKINDKYDEYRDRLEKTATVQWRSKSAIGDYGSQIAAVTLQQNGKIGFNFADQEIWSVVEQVDGPKGTAVAIDAVVHQRDALKLTPGITDKRDREFTLAVIDIGAKSDIVSTQFSVKIKTSQSNSRLGSFGNGITHYEGVLPATAVKQDYNRFLLNLGSLPVPEDTFKSGSDVEVEIKVVRSLGMRSATQTIDWSGTVY